MHCGLSNTSTSECPTRLLCCMIDYEELMLHLHCDVSALLSSDVRLYYMSRPVSTAAAPQQVIFRPDGPGAEAAETLLNRRYRVVRDLAR